MIATAAAITSALTTFAATIGVSAAAGSALATAFSIAGWVGASIIYGGMAVSIIASKKAFDLSSQSATYKGVLQTQTDQNLPLPLLYGTCKLAGNRIWQDEDATTNIKRIVAFAEGEICEYSDIKLNDIPINEISGIKIKRYYGTKEQLTDEIVGGKNQNERASKVGSLKDIAYLAITVPRSQKIDINYNLTAIVKGRKIRVYQTPYNYNIEYSENPAWVLFDFLTCYNGLGLGIGKDGNINDTLIQELFDINSFIEAANYCNELVSYSKVDKNGNVITEKQPRFTFNMIFDAQTSARNLLDEIYRSCRGNLITTNGKFQFKIDKPEPVSKVFTENDLIKGSEIFETLPHEEHYDILKCTYISPEHEWQKVEATAELEKYRNTIPIEHSINLYSVTNFHQASRLAWYYINAKRLQPYLGSFQTDYKAFSIEVGDVIAFNSILMGTKNYKVKVTSIKSNQNGLYTINWRSYDERLYDDKLGSKEPRVLISTLTDIVANPDDVMNFNVVQSNNLFNFVWEKTANPNDTYEIRQGNSWENSRVIRTGITGNKYSTEITTKGLFKFWIKAFNTYNYSKNATLDVINVDSIPQLNEIVKLNILENPQGSLDETLKIYRNTLKLKPNNILWQNENTNWHNNENYYQSAGIWGANVKTLGTYISQTYDLGAILICIVSFDFNTITTDTQNSVLIEWAYSENGTDFSEWEIINTGTYNFRYCKFKITLKSPNNMPVVLTNFTANIDVPDKQLDLELEITNKNGLKIDYSFIKPPSIVATVNDNTNAYVVITEKTNSYAILKAYTNTGEQTTCKVSLHAKGY